MTEKPPRDVFLEVDPAAPPVAPGAPGGGGDARESYLEVDDGAGAPSLRKKVRAADRGAAARDETSLAVVAALATERPLMAALWPDVAPAELLRSPPPEAAFAARCDFARRAIDAVARRDAESRARAEVAQRSLQQRLDALGRSGAPVEAALAELRRAQVAELEEALGVLSGGARVLYAAEVARLLAAAEARGLDADAARGVARERGYELREAEARTWAPLDALPGAPASMDAVAAALLQHPAQGYEAVRSGAVLAWLRANGASADVAERSREARMAAERGGAESLAVHTQAWALGRRELTLGRGALRSPGEIAPAVRSGAAVLDDLARASRDGTLGAWLRMHGWVAAAGAADLVARGEPSGMKRLAWSLGEPLVVGDQAVGDPASLARLALSRRDLGDALAALHASGDLLALLESLPPVLRDEQWADRLRRARADTTRAGDLLPVWQGLYAQARATAFTARDAAGHDVVLASPAQLRVTAQVAELWDSLKRALRSGELLAWLAVAAPEVELPALPRPPRDEDRELNQLLWALGHRGLVIEWGPRDLAVASPEDLVRAYQRSWQQFEAQAARGYVLDWLERFHGGAAVLPAAPGAAAVALRDPLGWLRAEVGRLPAGHLALKVALLAGMRHLPLDATEPGDATSFRGYTGVTRVPMGTRRAWEPLRDHAASGTALLWLALAHAPKPELARSMLQGAFLGASQGRAPDHVDQVLGALARTFGDPLPSPPLEAELAAASSTARHRAAATAHAPQLPPKARGGFLGRMASLALLGALGAGGYAWWQHRASLDPPQPAAAQGADVWVQLRVRVEADRTRQGAAWDMDGSAPDLRAFVHPRDETVAVGPCENARACDGFINAARLAPGVPFRVAVDEMDYGLPDRVGAAWLVWRGGREETLRARVGAAEVTVTVKRLAFQPPAAVQPSPPPAATTPDAGAARARTDAGTARSRADAGTSRQRTPRARARDAAPGPAPVGEPEPVAMEPPPFVPNPF